MNRFATFGVGEPPAQAVRGSPRSASPLRSVSGLENYAETSSGNSGRWALCQQGRKPFLAGRSSVGACLFRPDGCLTHSIVAYRQLELTLANNLSKYKVLHFLSLRKNLKLEL